MQIFPEKEYRGLSPNFHMHASVSYLYTSGFWPRVRAPVFWGSLPRETGRCAPLRPLQLCCFLFDPKINDSGKYYKDKFLRIVPPRLWNILVHYTIMFPAPPIAVSLSLEAKSMKTPRKFQFAKKSAKVYHCLYCIVRQSNCRFPIVIGHDD